MAEAGEQKGGKKMIVMLAVAVVLMAGFGAGGYLLGSKKGGGGGKGGEGGKGGPAIEAGAESGGEGGGQAVGPQVAFDDIIVNLLDDQEPRFLKAAITLELDNPLAVEEVNARKPQIRDAIILLLSNKTLPELRDMQGKLQLRADLLEKINGFLRKGRVKTLYFTDFIVQ